MTFFVETLTLFYLFNVIDDRNEYESKSESIMPLLDRSDLKYDYTWSTEPAQTPRTETTTQTETESKMFRRKDGDEVLQFINDYSDKYGIESKEDALEIERMLRDELKEEDMSRREVQLWLHDHMQKERV